MNTYHASKLRILSYLTFVDVQVGSSIIKICADPDNYVRGGENVFLHVVGDRSVKLALILLQHKTVKLAAIFLQ